jgi:hypothetical protein
LEKHVGSWFGAFAFSFAVSFAVACGGAADDAERTASSGSGGEGNAGGAGSQSDLAPIRWVRSLGNAYEGALVAASDGTAAIALTTDDGLEVTLSTATGEVAWQQLIEAGTGVSLDSWDRPSLAIVENGVIHAAFRAGGDTIVANGAAVACAGVCGVHAAYSRDGVLEQFDATVGAELVQVVSTSNGHARLTRNLGDGVLRGPQILLAGYSSDAVQLWETELSAQDFSPWLYVVSDGADAIYVVGMDQGAGCGVVARLSASDGEPAWEQRHCVDGATVSVSDPGVLRDGHLLVPTTITQRGGGTMYELVAIAPSGSREWASPLPWLARPTPFGEGGALLQLQPTGPLAMIDARGLSQWQWPGEPSDGEINATLGGPCAATAVEAPDGDFYLLTLACPAARTLLDASDVAESTEPQGDTREWLLARVSPDVATGYARSCGNGLLDPGELCDGEQFAGIQSCEEANLGVGPVGCVGCDYDFSECSGSR